MFNKKIRTRWLARIALIFVIAVVIVLPAIASSDADKLVSMPSYGDVNDFEITSDGEYVVFSADMDTDGETELYSVPMSGGTPTKLNLGPLLGIGFNISPDGAWVVYTHDYSIYSVPVAGPSSASIKLSGDDVIYIRWFASISPDSQWVVYMVEDPGNLGRVTALYSVPITGGTKTKLNKDLVAGGMIIFIKLVFSPDSQHVVYGASQDTVGMDELYSVPITGPASAGVKLNGALQDGGDLWWEYDISPDGSRVLYRADQETDGVYEIYSVPVAGPASQGVKLNGTLPDDADVLSFRISPDSSTVIYIADQETDGVKELYSVPIQGGSPIRLNHEMEYNYAWLKDQVHSFAISPDSSTVVYEGSWVNHVSDPFDYSFEVFELFSVPISGTVGVEEKLWSPSPYLGGLDIPAGYPERYPHPGNLAMLAGPRPFCDMEFNQASSILVSQPTFPTSNICDLWSVPIDDPESDERLTELDIFAGVEVHRFQISPDDARVVYSQEYTITIGTASSGLLQVNGPLTETTLTELFSVPIEGPASESQKLNGALVEGGNVTDWDISPDGCQVVYKADQDTDDVFELYIADQPCTPPSPSDTPTSTEPIPTPPTPEPGDDMKLFLPLTLRD